MSVNNIAVNKASGAVVKDLIVHLDKQDHELEIEKGIFVEFWRQSWDLIAVKQVNYMRFDKINATKYFSLDETRVFFVSEGTVNFKIIDLRSHEAEADFLQSDKKLQLLSIPKKDNSALEIKVMNAPARIYRIEDQVSKNFYETTSLLHTKIKKTEIDGVIIKSIFGQSGTPFEIDIPIFRLDDGFTKHIAQLNFTNCNAGEIKAFHAHHCNGKKSKYNKKYHRKYQFDEWFFDRGLGVVVLYDDRQKSESYGQKIMIEFDELTCKVIKIPPGVWHGYFNNSKGICNLVYNVTREYDCANPNEERYDFDDRRVGFDWNDLKFKKWFV